MFEKFHINFEIILKYSSSNEQFSGKISDHLEITSKYFNLEIWYTLFRIFSWSIKVPYGFFYLVSGGEQCILSESIFPELVALEVEYRSFGATR